MSNDLKGYVQVNTRVLMFYDKHPKGSIQTEVLEHNDEFILMRAKVYPDASNQFWCAMGHAKEYHHDKKQTFNDTSYVEVCETSAVGRALGMLGIGIEKSIASVEEVEAARTAKSEGRTTANVQHKSSQAPNGSGGGDTTKDVGSGEQAEQPVQSVDVKFNAPLSLDEIKRRNTKRIVSSVDGTIVGTSEGNPNKLDQEAAAMIKDFEKDTAKEMATAEKSVKKLAEKTKAAAEKKEAIIDAAFKDRSDVEITPSAEALANPRRDDAKQTDEQVREKLKALLMELGGGNVTEASKILESVTAYTADDGTEVPGLKSTKALMGHSLRVAYGKVKDVYEQASQQA